MSSLSLTQRLAFTPPPLPSLTPTPSKPNTGAIVGGVLAAVVVLVILAASVFLLNRRRRRRRELEAAMRVQAEGRKISELDNEKPRGELASPIPELPQSIPELASPIPEFPSPTPALQGMETSEKPVGTMSIAGKP
jgi:LPXTG-motif cell wall-anchored protein